MDWLKTADGLFGFDIPVEELGGVALRCWFEYEPAEYGRGFEPDYPEMWTLMHVYAPGSSSVDIAPLLSTEVLNQLEEWAARTAQMQEDEGF